MKAKKARKRPQKRVKSSYGQYLAHHLSGSKSYQRLAVNLLLVAAVLLSAAMVGWNIALLMTYGCVDGGMSACSTGLLNVSLVVPVIAIVFGMFLSVLLIRLAAVQTRAIIAIAIWIVMGVIYGLHYAALNSYGWILFSILLPVVIAGSFSVVIVPLSVYLSRSTSVKTQRRLGSILRIVAALMVVAVISGVFAVWWYTYSL